ncbi:hypothetical protein BDB01DRAFT_856796 [Pilobolus umbonatus]|nr:hypothetical protein BDB01DRAFT_856796 [Pilobolus umbonatus]
MSKHQTFKNQEEVNRWFKSSLVRSYGHVREWMFQTKVTCETDTDNFVGVQDTVNLNLEPLWPHVPVRLNKRKFKPRIPANKRAKPRPNPPTN